MRTSQELAVGAIAAILGHTSAIPIVVHPGGANDLVITSQDTLNETISVNDAIKAAPLASNAAEELSISVYNNFQSDGINIYVTGLGPNGDIVCLTSSGSWYTPVEIAMRQVPKKSQKTLLFLLAIMRQLLRLLSRAICHQVGFGSQTAT